MLSFCVDLFVSVSGQGAKSQLGAILPTRVPSGHCFASIVQATIFQVLFLSSVFHQVIKLFSSESICSINICQSFERHCLGYDSIIRFHCASHDAKSITPFLHVMF